MAPLRAKLILIHRCLGIALALLFFVWFVSGIAMMYARDMPRLTPEVRLARLPALDLSRVRISAWQAAERADLGRSPGRMTLVTVQDRPAYRFGGSPPVTVFADTGDVMGPIGEQDSLAVAARFMGVALPAVRYVRTLNSADQWTIAQRRQLPLHKIAVDDEARTELYVSAGLGEVVVVTTRGTRALAWIAAIPHWLYIAPLRLNDAVWRQVILWTSGLAVVSAAIGLVLAFTQFSVAYSGLMRWHYRTGAAFGLFAVTWAFSGFLSMEPWDWAASDRPGPSVTPALGGGTMDAASFPPIDAAAWTSVLGGHVVKEIDFRWLRGGPWYVARGDGPQPLLIDARTLDVRTEPSVAPAMLEMLATLSAANPDAPIASAELLASYDAYYYDRDRQAPLPVVRIRFDDPDRTWVYVSPHLFEVVGRFTRRERVERWMYHGLHSLDFPFWYSSRAWEAGMILLLSGGAALSGIGVMIGWRRLKHIVS